jgi:hypothetical protein
MPALRTSLSTLLSILLTALAGCGGGTLELPHGSVGGGLSALPSTPTPTPQPTIAASPAAYPSGCVSCSQPLGTFEVCLTPLPPDSFGIARYDVSIRSSLQQAAVSVWVTQAPTAWSGETLASSAVFGSSGATYPHAVIQGPTIGVRFRADGFQDVHLGYGTSCPFPD